MNTKSVALSSLLTLFSFTAMAAGTSVPKGGDFSLEKKWETTGFSMPESVFANANHPWLYVSNVNGADPGFISRVAKDGTVDSLKWATGLSSPTGSDMYNNLLYVADATELHLIDVTSGKIVNSYTANGAISLNDVTIEQSTGVAYVSDVPGGKIFQLKDDKLSLWFESQEIPYPNGVLIQDNTLIVANYAIKNGKGLMRQDWGPDDFGSLFKIDLTTKSVTVMPASVKKGGYDGVIEFNGALVTSSNPSGQILGFDGQQGYLIDSTDKGVADINTDGETLYAPYLLNNKLSAFQSVAWDRITSKQEYLDKAADNYYGDAEGKSIATHDGVIKGIFGGQQLTGNWTWEGEFFCRTSTLGSMDLGADCIQIDVTPNKMRLVLNKGEGMSVVYDKKPANEEISILSTFKIKPELVDLYKKEMLGNQDVVRKEAGTLEMKLFQEQSTPSNFFVFGRNAGAAELSTHSENVEERGIAERVQPALAEAPKTLFLENQLPLLTQDVEIFNADADDVLLFYVFDVQADHREKLIKQLTEHTKSTRLEEGNIRFDFYTVKDNQNTFVIHEHWQNEQAGTFHRAQAYTQKTGELMIEAIGEMPQQLSFVNQIENESKMIQMIGRFHMKPEGRDAFIKAMADVRQGTERETGSLGIRMFDDRNNPNLMFGYERFMDFDAVKFHREQPYEKALIEVATSTLTEPPHAYVLGTALVGEVRAPRKRIVANDEFYSVALFDLDPEQVTSVIAQYQKQIPNARAQEGNVSFNVYPVLDNPKQLAVIEWWESPEQAQQFAATDPLSMETEKLLVHSLKQPIDQYVHVLNERTH